MYLVYNLLIILFFIVAFPIFGLYVLIRGKYRDSFWKRVGFYPSSLKEEIRGEPRIWIHAVSVGEIIAISSLVTVLKRIYPQACLILSTGTETGQLMAQKMATDASLYLYFPFDFPWAVRRALNLIQPDIFIDTETEIWPNFLRMARKKGIATMLANGRVSIRSIGKYLKFKPFIKKVLENFQVMSMILPIDAERIISMGAIPARVFVSGNCKYDKLADQVNPAFEKEMREVLSISTEEKVFIAGSTREGEEELILKGYKRLLEHYPEMLLIIVPRHIERTKEIEDLVVKEGFPYILKTEINQGRKRKKEKIILLNTIGELFKVYSLGTIVFCGASFVPKGGQNILEPAAWGKVVFYGPSMEDFLDAKELLESVEAGMQVKDIDELVEKALDLLADEDKLKRLGLAGREVIMANRGAAWRNAQFVKELLEKRSEKNGS